MKGDCCGGRFSTVKDLIYAYVSVMSINDGSLTTICEVLPSYN